MSKDSDYKILQVTLPRKISSKEKTQDNTLTLFILLSSVSSMKSSHHCPPHIALWSNCPDLLPSGAFPVSALAPQVGKQHCSIAVCYQISLSSLLAPPQLANSSPLIVAQCLAPLPCHGHFLSKTCCDTGAPVQPECPSFVCAYNHPPPAKSLSPFTPLIWWADNSWLTIP